MKNKKHSTFTKAWLAVAVLVAGVLLNTQSYAQHHKKWPPIDTTIVVGNDTLHFPPFPHPGHDSFPPPPNPHDSFPPPPPPPPHPHHPWDSAHVIHWDSLHLPGHGHWPPPPPHPRKPWDSLKVQRWDSLHHHFPFPPFPHPGHDSFPPPPPPPPHPGHDSFPPPPPPPPHPGHDSFPPFPHDSFPPRPHPHPGHDSFPPPPDSSWFPKDTGAHRLGIEGTASGISVYPNPMETNTTVHIQSTSGNVTFVMFDAVGKLSVRKESLTNGDYIITKDSLRSGIYLYQVYEGSKIISVGKLVVQ